MNVALVLVAGGKGRRFGGDLPKQYLELGGIPLIMRTLNRFDGLVAFKVVVADDVKIASNVVGNAADKVVPGGSHRQFSVYHGLKALKDVSPDVVLIHDAVRPFVKPEEVTALIDEAGRFGGATLGRRPNYTIFEAKDGFVSRILNREALVSIHTPQAFRYSELLHAYEMFLESLTEFTDDAGIFVNGGGKVKIVDTSAYNIKITTPLDFKLAEEILFDEDI